MNNVTHAQLRAISVKFVGPTNFHSSRYVASIPGGIKITHEYDRSLSEVKNQELACSKLITKLNWEGLKGKWVGGNLEKGTVFVFIPEYLYSFL